MAWPSGSKAPTTNVDAGTDSVSSARADIKQNIDNVNDIIDHINISSPSDGQVLQYSSSSGKWEQVASTSVGGVSGSLVIPFGGYVVNQWSGSDAGDSGGLELREKKFRMVTLGGKYYDTSTKGTQTTSDLSLVSTEQTVFGEIVGATVTRATPTLNKPTGFSVTGANNFSLTITNGILTVGDQGAQPTTSFTMNGNIAGINNASGPKDYNVQYASGWDNYVTLPAGTYVVSLKSVLTSLNTSYNTQTGLESDTDVIAPTTNGADFWIYNKTDDVEITPSDGSISNLDMANWSKDIVAVFTLSTQADIQFFQSVNQSVTHFGTDANTPVNGRDYLGFTFFATPSGDVTTSGGNYFFDDATAGTIPAKLGWYDVIANTYIKIDKIST